MKLPMMYSTVGLNGPMRRTEFYRLYLYFTITSNVTKSDELINNKLDGQFSLEVHMSNKTTELHQIPSFNGLKETVASIQQFIKSDDMIELSQSLVDLENARIRKQYSSDYESFEIPTVTVSLKNYVPVDDSL